MKTSLSMDASDQKKTRTKLKKFLIRRPTYQAVRDKGYIKGSARRRRHAAEPSFILRSGLQLKPVLLLMSPEQVFGSSLSSLCQRENTSVPNFVKMCIGHVENTGIITVECPAFIGKHLQMETKEAASMKVDI